MFCMYVNQSIVWFYNGWKREKLLRCYDRYFKFLNIIINLNNWNDRRKSLSNVFCSFSCVQKKNINETIRTSVTIGWVHLEKFENVIGFANKASTLVDKIAQHAKCSNYFSFFGIHTTHFWQFIEMIYPW